VYRNGAIYTVSDQLPWARAMAVKGDRIVYVGGEEGAKPYIGAGTQVVDLGGSMVMPGIHDGHTHMLLAGQLQSLACKLPAGPFNDLSIAALKACAEKLPREAWLVGSLYAPAQFPDGKPHRRYLDQAFPDRPVFLHESSLHNGLANSKALELAGITEASVAPPGGRLLRDETGKLTGEVLESATGVITRAIPAYTAAQNAGALLRSVRIDNQYGITSVQEAAATNETLEALAILEHDRALTLHVDTHLVWSSRLFNKQPEADVDALIGNRARYASAHVNVDNIKMFIDGAPIPPYFTQADLDAAGKPELDKVLIEPDKLNQYVTRFDAMGLKVKMHVAGAGAAHVALDAIEHARRINGWSGILHDLGHTNLVTVPDMVRMAALGAVGEMSPAVWQIYGGTLGDPPQKAWQFRTLSDHGVLLTLGTDWVVTETPNLFPGLGGMLSFGDESLDLISAVRALTVNGAIATGRRKKLGSLEPGKLATFIVLDRNLFTSDPKAIAETRVLKTVFEGRVVYGAVGTSSISTEGFAAPKTSSWKLRVSQESGTGDILNFH
jgi:hypothetical protein